MLFKKQTSVSNDVYKGQSFWQDVWKRLWRNKKAWMGAILCAIIFGTCIYGFIFVDYTEDVVAQDVMNQEAFPSWEHPFGTDNFGRDILARIVYGSRYSLIIGFSATAGSLLVGTALGCIAGYFGGVIDDVIMRVTDVFIAIPGTLMAIAVVSALGTSLFNLIVAITIGGIPGYARVIRSTVISIKDNEFVEASIVVGGSHTHVILHHIFPNTLSAIIVQATLGVGYNILTASGLSYLGLGVMPPAPEWGAMLSEGQDVIRYAPHVVIFPGVAIVLTVLALNLLGDALRDAIDPTLRD